jgi:hypothetical protein
MKRPRFGESHWPVKNELSPEARKRAVAGYLSIQATISRPP